MGVSLKHCLVIFFILFGFVLGGVAYFNFKFNQAVQAEVVRLKQQQQNAKIEKEQLRKHKQLILGTQPLHRE